MGHSRSGATCLHVLGTCSPGKTPPGAIPARETLEQDRGKPLKQLLEKAEHIQLICDKITMASELLVQFLPYILKPP